MDGLSRRTAIVGGITLLSGCINNTNNRRQPSESNNTTEQDTQTQDVEQNVTDSDQDQENDSNSDQDENQDQENDPNSDQDENQDRKEGPGPDSDSDVVRMYGEPFVDSYLEITVETPSVETALEIETDQQTAEPPEPPISSILPDTNSGITTLISGASDTDTKQIELPDGQAIVLAPVTFSNRHETESLSAIPPNFKLINTETEINETRTITHPDVEDSIAPEDIKGIGDLFFRWTANGTLIDPGESVQTVAMFEVTDDTNLHTFDIVYSPDLNNYGSKIDGNTSAAWTQ